MNTTIQTILISLVTGGLGVAIANGYFNRKKSSAETHNLNITGGIDVGDFGMKAAAQMEARLNKVESDKAILDDKFDRLRESFNKVGSDYMSLQREFTVMKEEFEKVKIEKQTLAEKNVILLDRVGVLENQVVKLTAQVESYKSNGEHLVDLAHEKLNELSEEIKK